MTGELVLNPPRSIDEALAPVVRRAKAGDLAAFEQLMRQHERLVWRVAIRVLGNEADAEDVAQEVFLRLHRSLQQFDESQAFAPWLYRMTVNLCLDHRRRLSRHSLEPLDGHEELGSGSAGPEETLSREERKQALQAGLATLPAKERAALVLRDIEGLSTEQVAEALGSSATTVRSQISTARTKLRRFVEQWMKGKS